MQPIFIFFFYLFILTVYPYDYMDSFEKINADQLSPKVVFYSSLKKKGMSNEDYTHAQDVFQFFEMIDLGDYLNLYLNLLLLANIFESFNDIWMENYGLNPAYVHTASELAWQAF